MNYKTILKNVVALAFGEFSSKAFGFLTMIYLAKTLGAEQFGMVGFVSAIASYAVLFSNFGIEQYAAQRLSSHRFQDVRDLIGHVLSTRFLLSILLIIPFIIFGINYTSSISVQWLFIFQSIFIIAYALNLQFYFVSQKKFTSLAIVKILTAGSILIVTWFFVTSPNDLAIVTFISGSVTFFVFVAAVLFIVKKEKIALSMPTMHGVRQLLSNAAPLGISALMIQIYYSADVIFLGFTNPGVELGYYTGVYRLILVLTLISGFLYQIFLPELAKLKENHFHQFQTKFYIVFMICTGGIITIVSYIWAYEIVKVILGSEYILAVGVFNILLVNVFMVFVNVSFGSLLIVWNRHKEYLIVVSAGAMFNVIGNIILIPHYGIYGAAISTVAAECAVFLIAFYFNQKIFGLFNSKKATAF